MASRIEIIAAELAAALKSGNAQASEAALAHYDELGPDVDEADIDLGPIKRVLSPEEAAEVSEVGGGTEDDQEAAAVNASDDTPATTTINAGDEKSMDEIAQPIDQGADVEAAHDALVQEKANEIALQDEAEKVADEQVADEQDES